MKKQRCSHIDEEDPGGVCVRKGAVSLENRWGALRRVTLLVLDV